jgi:uncharacterized protein
MRVFDRPGPINTDEVIDIVEKASSLSDCIVVASVTGDSALKLAGRIRNKNIICVTCPQGMNWEVDGMNKGPFAEVPELALIRDRWISQGIKKVPMNIPDENRVLLEKMKVGIIRGTIPLFGPSLSLRLHLNEISSLDIIAKTLELVSTGTLVCMECVMMAVDSGLVPENEKVLALAGTERGLDTVWLVRSCSSANLFHPAKGFRFIELLAKPGISLQPEMNIGYLR